jgi:sialate O-acetylesterase
MKDPGTYSAINENKDPMRLVPAEESDSEGIGLTGTWLLRVGYATAASDIPPSPRKPQALEGTGSEPTVLYNGMIAPLVRIPIRGVIWYQGESNAQYHETYAELFRTLIATWRAAWEKPHLPFLWVQISSFDATPEDATDTTWAHLREAQSQALDLPHTAEVISYDVGEHDNIHPVDKHTVGHRLALAARRAVYGEAVVAESPRCVQVTQTGNTLRLQFTGTASGLVARGGILNGFEIVPTDGHPRPAHGRIEGNSVLLELAPEESILEVRYAWGNAPRNCTLYSHEGLPAAPFRKTIGTPHTLRF